MKTTTKVSSLQVKRTFVIGDLAKPRGGHSFSYKAFKTHLHSVKKRVFSLKEPRLDQIIGKYKKRLDAYNTYHWQIKDMTPKELGVWRRAGDLPLSFTNRSLRETAQKVSWALAHKPAKLKRRSRRAIPAILETNVDILQAESYLFPIVFKGGTGTRPRRWLRFKTKGDIDDGCMRSIALAIAGRKKIRVYFGTPLSEFRR